MRQVVVHPGEDGYWVAECPRLPGCITQGETRKDALENAKGTIEGYLVISKRAVTYPSTAADRGQTR